MMTEEGHFDRTVRDVRLLSSIPLLTCVLSTLAYGTFVSPNPAPVERLIRNTTAYIEENPKDAHGYYTLARIHYLAFANKSGLVGAFENKTPPKIPEDWLEHLIPHARHKRAQELMLKEYGYSSQRDIPYEKRQGFHDARRKKLKELEEQGWVPEKLEENELFEHANAAMKYFQKAIEIDSENALAHHGLACLIEQYVQLLNEKESQLVPEEFKKFLLNKARETYYTAYSISHKKESWPRLRRKPTAGLRSLVSYEAGSAYVRLSGKLGSETKEEKENLKRVKSGLEGLERLPKSRIVTPIIFSLEQDQSLKDLLAQERKVQFDLDGDGTTELRPWLKPATGILVWDPEKKAAITSGRQLFGSVSWWLFYEDGYKALNALDDNRDGLLSNSETEGIRVWFDRNSNGCSEKKEVVELTELGIVAIGTKATGMEDGMPMCLSGLTYSDGTAVPTYDWVVD